MRVASAGVALGVGARAARESWAIRMPQVCGSGSDVRARLGDELATVELPCHFQRLHRALRSRWS